MLEGRPKVDSQSLDQPLVVDVEKGNGANGGSCQTVPAATWFQVVSTSGRQLIQDAQTGQLRIINPRLQLQQTPPEPVSNPSSVHVISWDPSRPLRGPAHQSAQLDSPDSCLGARIFCHLG